jgi:hypothetical protein
MSVAVYLVAMVEKHDREVKERASNLKRDCTNNLHQSIQKILTKPHPELTKLAQEGHRQYDVRVDFLMPEKCRSIFEGVLVELLPTNQCGVEVAPHYNGWGIFFKW